jgi:glycerol dehydrogenase
LISVGIAKQCLDVIYSQGEKAKMDCERHEVTENLEELVEANILLSGLGAESGGLAVAHGLHNALTLFPECHHFLHGEKVAFGTIVQLMMEKNLDEALRVGKFCHSVGLPTSLRELNIQPTRENVERLAELCLEPDNTTWNLGENITKQEVVRAISGANNLILGPL